MSNRLGWAALAMVICLAAPLWADTLYLKDGRMVRGEIVSETDEVVSVKEPIGTSGYAQAQYPTTQIERIERAAAAPPAPHAASSAADRRLEPKTTDEYRASEGSSDAAGPSLAYKLATLDSPDGYVSNDDVTVARFRSLLRQLSTTFVENEQQIADMTLTARQMMLRDDGIKESMLNMMEGMNQVFTKRIENQQYAEYITAYITLRQKGQSHTDAISGLQGILRAVGAR